MSIYHVNLPVGGVGVLAAQKYSTATLNFVAIAVLLVRITKAFGVSPRPVFP
jgi:hypothetical protein